MPTKTVTIILITTPIILAIIASQILLGTVLSNPEQFTNWLKSFGPYVVLVYVLIQAASIIIPPIGGFFMQIAVIALFEPAVALTLIYLVATPLYLVNFYIARRYGREVVKRIVGAHTLGRIDHYAQDLGTLTLVILKVFQGSIFDYLSYAAGLTNIPFKTFLLVNVLGGIPALFVSYNILSRFDNLTVGIIVLLIFSYTLIGLSILLNHYLKKHRRV